jgi:hypothetical protein
MSVKESQVLAQGDYEYLCDGRIVPVRESWQLSRTESGLTVFSQRTIPFLSVVIAARATFSTARMERCLLQWRSLTTGESIAMATYAASPEQGLYRYRHRGSPARSVAVQDAHYFPLLRVFVGGIIHALVAEGGSGRVLVPWIHDPAQQTRLFEPEFSLRSARYQGSSESDKPWGKERVKLDHFHYSGGQYECGADYWLASGLLQEYRWRQGSADWGVRLRNLVGRWPGAELWSNTRPTVSLNE